MNVETTLETNAQFVETCKPGMRAFDDLAMPSKSLLALYRFAGDTSCDAAPLLVAPTKGEVVALVRMQFSRVFAGLGIQARYRRPHRLSARTPSRLAGSPL